MAAGWMSLLKAVPWADVIAKAPEVASSARKLWGTVRRQQGAESGAAAEESEVAQADPLAVLDERLERNEQSIKDLGIQMTQCSELLAQMAEQNSLLVAKVEAERRRTTLVAVAAGISFAVAVASLLMAAGVMQ